MHHALPVKVVLSLFLHEEFFQGVAVGDGAADTEDEEAGHGDGHVLPMHGTPGGGGRGGGAGSTAQGLGSFGAEGADMFAHVRRPLHGERVVRVVVCGLGVVVVVAVVAVAVFLEALFLAGDGDELLVVDVRQVELLLDVFVDALHVFVVRRKRVSGRRWHPTVMRVRVCVVQVLRDVVVVRKGVLVCKRVVG